MRVHFGRLVSSVENQLDRNGVSLDDIVSELEINLNSPEYEDDGKRLADIYSFFSFVTTAGYMPFYSLYMLESIVDKFAQECHPLLDEYKVKHLRPFLLKCLPDIEEECFDHMDIAGQVELIIKIDRDWDTTRMLDMLELTKSVAAIVDIRHEQLVIETIREGCVQVVCRIPCKSAVTSLMDSQKRDLKRLSVAQLVCDGVTLYDGYVLRTLLNFHQVNKPNIYVSMWGVVYMCMCMCLYLAVSCDIAISWE